MRLWDKVAIITGSTPGIGRAAAERLVADGARVTVIERREEEGRRVEQELRRLVRESGGDGLFVRTDLLRPEDVCRAVTATVERRGRLALQRMREAGSELFLVQADGTLLGLLTPENLTEFLLIRAAMQGHTEGPRLAR